jgi:hypothetical protein
MTSQKRLEREAAQREAATANFIAHKNEIDRLLTVIAEESALHFGVDPDTLSWADAGDLAQITAKLIGIDPDDIRVRNLTDDYPGTKDDGRIARLNITRAILADSIHGGIVPHIIVQPQLLIPTSPGPQPYFFIAPDLLVWSARHGCYLPGDLKSFIVRENEVARGDLARVRLQLGAHVLALRHEYHRLDPAMSVTPQGLLIFSQPNGLRPHAPRIEDLGGAVEAIRNGITAFLRHRELINRLRAGAAPYTVAADLEPNFQDSCLASCVMAQWCRERVAGRAADIGDVAGEVLGDVTIDHVIGLLKGAVAPADEHEQIVAERLQTRADQHEAGRAA